MTNASEHRARQIEQGDLWEELRVEHHWFHIVRGMIYRGLLRDMGTMGWAVYCVLKAHTDLESGQARPSIKRIAELIGVSHDTVQRAMNHLVKLDLVTVEKRGKNNNYVLREQMAMTTRTGELYGVAEREYAPNYFSDFVDQLKRFAKSGNVPTDKAITINVTLNIQNITQGDGGTVTMDIQNIQTASETPRAVAAVADLQKKVAGLKYLKE
jgi:DNA-binding transcriptional regulator YhcF (GntR family)